MYYKELTRSCFILDTVKNQIVSDSYKAPVVEHLFNRLDVNNASGVMLFERSKVYQSLTDIEDNRHDLLGELFLSIDFDGYDDKDEKTEFKKVLTLTDVDNAIKIVTNLISTRPDYMGFKLVNKKHSKILDMNHFSEPLLNKFNNTPKERRYVFSTDVGFDYDKEIIGFI